MKQKLMKGKIKIAIIKFEDFNTPFAVIDRTSRQKSIGI